MLQQKKKKKEQFSSYPDSSLLATAFKFNLDNWISSLYLVIIHMYYFFKTNLVYFFPIVVFEDFTKIFFSIFSHKS